VAAFSFFASFAVDSLQSTSAKLGSMELRHRIWNLMGPERRLAAAQAFWAEKSNAHAEAEAMITKRLHVRPVFVRRLTPEKKAAYVANDPAINAGIWDAVMVAYHLAAQRGLLADFLNAVGIANENGRLGNTDAAAPPTAEQLNEAVRAVSEKHDKTDLLVYLAALSLQDERLWQNLPPVIVRLETEVRVG
jgi:hypothetical protein